MRLRKYICFLLIFMISLLINTDVYALKGIVNGTDVRVRSGAGTTYESLGKTHIPTSYELLDENKIPADDETGEDCSHWYKISYNDKTGYICSIYLTISNDSFEGGTGNFEEDLLKFPVSYRDKIKELHLIYPNASFTVLNTGLDWQNVINGENYISSGSPKHNARSLIQTKYDGYKSTNSILYNWSTNVWNTNISGGGSSWFAAHEGVISYYVDPRNFLTHNGIFMFLNHGYSKNVNYNVEAINNILKNSFMVGMTNDGVHTFAEAFLAAGEESGISPYYLAARVIQEIGRSKTRSSYVDGKYNGYYNYYNIDAAGDNHLVNALTRAKTEGWNNDYKAIIGGAMFIADGYVSTGQSTLYLEKWDVIDGGNGFFSHQYMQNIQAPVTEANTLYNTYVENELTSSNMEFLIPVYNNMPVKTSLPNTGNPNNYLKDITINGYTISGFDMKKQEYNYNVSNVTSNVEIGIGKISNVSSVTGVGNIEIKDAKYTHTITVKAGNGDVRKYVINFTKDESKPISISDLVNLSGYVSDGTNISGIKVGSKANSLANKMKEAASDINIKITDINGKEKTEEVLATGDKVSISTVDDSKIYTVLIYGDVDGNGLVDKLDYLAVLRHYYNYKKYTGVYSVAADVNRDAVVDKLDYLAILRDFYEYAKIEQ